MIPVKDIVPVSVVSSTMKAAGYDGQRQILRIWFHTGNVYDYKKVPKKIFTELLDAESLGAYFNYHIKPFYDFEKVK